MYAYTLLDQHITLNRDLQQGWIIGIIKFKSITYHAPKVSHTCLSAQSKFLLQHGILKFSRYVPGWLVLYLLQKFLQIGDLLQVDIIFSEIVRTVVQITRSI